MAATVTLTSDAYDGRSYTFTVTQTSYNQFKWTFKSSGGSSNYYACSPITCKVSSTVCYEHAAQNNTVHSFPVTTGSEGGTVTIPKYGTELTVTLSGRPYYNTATSKTAKITFEKYSYTVAYYDKGKKVGTSTFDCGTAYNLTTASTLGISEDGFKFYGWSTADNSSTRSYTNGKEVTNLSTTNGATVKLYSLYYRTVTWYSGALQAYSSTTNGIRYYSGTSALNYVPVTTDYSSLGSWTAVGWRGGPGFETNTSKTAYSFPIDDTVYRDDADVINCVYEKTDATFYYGAKKASSKTAKRYYNSSGRYAVEVPTVTATLGSWTKLGWRQDTDAKVAEFTDGIRKILGDGVRTTEFYAVYSQNDATFYYGEYKENSTTSTRRYNTEGNYAVDTPTLSTTYITWTRTGWRADTTATTKTYNDGTTYQLGTSQTKTFYATYVRDITIKYDANTGSGTAPADSVKKQYYNSGLPASGVTEGITLANNTFTRDASIFRGWVSLKNNIFAEGSIPDAFPLTQTAITQTWKAAWSEFSKKNNGTWSKGIPYVKRDGVWVELSTSDLNSEGTIDWPIT